MAGPGTPGDWRPQYVFPTGERPPAELTVRLLRDGRPVDSEHVRLRDALSLGEAFQLAVPTLQLP
jgi:hypothetical protein